MQETIQYIEKKMAGLFPKPEIDGTIRIIFEEICGLNFTDFILQKNRKISADDFNKIEKVVARLTNFEPIQYILGESAFFDLKLKVNPAVLIPRPETEELVHWIIQENNIGAPTILDVGTGSGCIALALKSRIVNGMVSGVDISQNALKVARENSIKNSLKVDFFQSDILNWEKYEWGSFDVIVSNPPYVRNSEKQQMQSNVLDYEPQTALFVSDNDPLIFYRRISEFAQRFLNENGQLFFEINEALGNEMKQMLGNCGFKKIEIKKDINGKQRMMRCKKME